MRVLTVRQPWAWTIVHGSKNVENRRTNIAGDYRGPVAIQAGLVVESDASRVWDLPGYLSARDASTSQVRRRLDVRGAILGVVDLVDVHRARRHYKPIDGTPWVMECTDQPCCAPWGEREAHHLVLENPRPLSEPLPFKGALGLRSLQPATVALVLRRLEVA